MKQVTVCQAVRQQAQPPVQPLAQPLVPTTSPTTSPTTKPEGSGETQLTWYFHHIIVEIWLNIVLKHWHKNREKITLVLYFLIRAGLWERFGGPMPCSWLEASLRSCDSKPNPRRCQLYYQENIWLLCVLGNLRKWPENSIPVSLLCGEFQKALIQKLSERQPLHRRVQHLWISFLIAPCLKLNRSA